MSTTRTAFDADYYRRFYVNPRTRSVTDLDMERYAAFVAAYLRHLGVAVRRVLDMGCGMGLMREPLQNYLPGIEYCGVDVSPYACEQFGWIQASVTDFSSDRPFDLVICHDVLQYLSDRNAARALNNLARLCGDALALGVLTREDWDQETCDRTRTDDRVYLRDTAWYRTRLARRFVAAGGGLFLKRDRDPVLWSLERMD